MGLLKQEGFDQELVEIIKDFNRERGRRITLVFDSADYMGDKRVDGWLTIVYTPKDGYYKNADDKILELARLEREAVVVTDDIDLRKKVEREKILTKSASSFAKEIEEKSERVDSEEKFEDDELTEELMRVWR